MATIRPVLFRPVEHVQDLSGVDFTIGGNNYSITSGVYANALALWRAVLLEASEFDQIGISDNLCLEFSSSVSDTLVWVNTDLMAALGFDASVVFAAYVWSTAPYTPTSVWAPERHFADQGAWDPGHERRFIGAVAANGSIAGMINPSTYKSRTHVFNHELSTRIAREFCTTQAEIDRCLQEFVIGAIESRSSVSTNPKTKGCWYYQDINDAIADCQDISETWSSSGSVDFALGSKYVFCNFDPDKPISWIGSCSLPVSRVRYHVTINLITAPAPTFVTVVVPQ